MKKIILGKSNNFLSFFINTLYLNYDCSSLDIVKNLNDDENTIEKIEIPYKIPDINISEFNYFDYNNYNNDNNYVLGVYNPINKHKVYSFFLENYNINLINYSNIFGCNVVLPKVYTIGNGCFINHNTTIEPFCKIGDFVSINRNCSIGHHCILNDFITISPGVNIASNCNIGCKTFIGIGATIINNITIGENVIVGAGSLVTKNIPDNCVYYGSPAKFVRFNQS